MSQSQPLIWHSQRRQIFIKLKTKNKGVELVFLNPGKQVCKWPNVPLSLFVLFFFPGADAFITFIHFSHFLHICASFLEQLQNQYLHPQPCAYISAPATGFFFICAPTFVQPFHAVELYMNKAVRLTIFYVSQYGYS